MIDRKNETITGENDTAESPGYTGNEIAVIALAGRFPGADTIEQFWENLKNGVESIRFFSDEELAEAGVSADVYTHPDYIRARGILNDVEFFDPDFFGFNPREAAWMDVQHRIFLTCAWEALERGGYDPDRYPGLVGVYAGANMNTYFLRHLYPQMADSTARGNAAAAYQAIIGNEKDFLPAITAYKLNLKGPGICVQTACSTSLVAVHTACQALLAGECDMALAGGVGVDLPQKTGYMYEQGMILSPDGHCRAFDAKAGGTVQGNGCGIVLLKRLDDALEEGDEILAVIKGSAVNNDGSLRVGFTSPGVEGQAAVIEDALAIANVDAETIGYVEAHGTGTPLGDPVEIRALIQVFDGVPGNCCAIGSVKTNIGHCGAAAGIAGFIKTVLALKHDVIPPSLHFKTPNPEIDFQNSPFYVNSILSPWPEGRCPARAGVSSFGIGGTNAHVVLEAPPSPTPVPHKNDAWQVLTLSAKTPEALAQSALNLGGHLARHQTISLPDVAFTLQTGRKNFNHRLALVARSAKEAAQILGSDADPNLLRGISRTHRRPVVFMFPGQGAQYAEMGAGLYRSMPVYRETLDQCADILTEHLGYDIREILYPAQFSPSVNDLPPVNHTAAAQPLLFAVSYALASQWMAFGVKPAAMIGHSIGEYVAACLSGVFSLEDALHLVARRGMLMGGLPGGVMLAVPLSEEEMMPFLGDFVELAAVNADRMCVLSGPEEEMENTVLQLKEKGVAFQRLHTSHAFHSGMMEPVIEPFMECVRQVERHSPKIPFISNLTGIRITSEQAVDPAYWASHLRRTVRFGDGIRNLMKETDAVLLEVGPGKTLGSLARQQDDSATRRPVLSTLCHPKENTPDEAFLLTTLAKQWLNGADVNWDPLHKHPARRVPLPPYPFAKQRCWVDPVPVQTGTPSAEIVKTDDISRWFYLPSWQRKPLPAMPEAKPGAESCLIFCDDNDIGGALCQQMTASGIHTVRVETGHAFEKRGDGYFSINPANASDYHQLFQQLKTDGEMPGQIIHLWSLSSHKENDFDAAQNRGFFSLLFLGQALSAGNPEGSFHLLTATNRVQAVTGDEASLIPENATALGVMRVLSQEFPRLQCRSLDLDLHPPLADGAVSASVAAILDEVDGNISAENNPAAIRNGHRWELTYLPYPLPEKPAKLLRPEGVYLITGGLGNVGMAMAAYLAETVNARLVLTSRSGFPETTPGQKIPASTQRKQEQLDALKELGADVRVVQADAADRNAMEAAIELAETCFGKLNGVIHAAGITGEEAVRAFESITPDDVRGQFNAKIKALYVLEEVLEKRSPDFCMITSSLASELGGLGFSVYAAANRFADAFAWSRQKQASFLWISINWDGWRFDADESGTGDSDQAFRGKTADLAMTPKEGMDAMARILAFPHPQMLVSTGDLNARAAQWGQISAGDADGAGPSTIHKRPEIATPYVPPGTPDEKTLAGIIEDLLGIEQVGIHDDFFDLGGHSLLATQAASRIQAAFGVSIPLARLFETPTVAGLAEALTESPAEVEQNDELKRLLAELDEMSEDELRRHLKRQV